MKNHPRIKGHSWASDLLLMAGLSNLPLAAASPNYDEHILPIFEQSCTNCHNPDKQKGDLDLTTYGAALRGGSGGAIAEPGEGVDSKIYGVITHTLKPKMPPKGDKLDKKHADMIRAWVDGGLLENASGKPKKKKAASFALQAIPSTGKPDGPPPMPRHILLEPVVTTSRATAVTDMQSSPWAPLLAVTGQRQVLLYHSQSLELVGVLPFAAGQPEVLSFHPSGKYLLAGGGVGGKSGSTVTWEVETGRPVMKAGRDFDSVLAASLRADLAGVSLGGPGKRVKLWDVESDSELISIKKHTDWVTQLAYSHDGVLLASGGRGGGVYVWEGDSGNEFYNLRGHKAAITALSWRADSNLLATASEDGDVLVWSMKNGKQVAKFAAHGGGVLDVDWHRSGLLVTSGRDNKVKIWKADFKLQKALPEFSSLVLEVALSDDGKRVFCGEWSGEISVWDVSSAKLLGHIAANPPSVEGQIKAVKLAIHTLPTQTEKARKALQLAESDLAAKQKSQQELKAKQQKLRVQNKQWKVERAKLDKQLKQAAEDHTSWQKKRQLAQQRMEAAERELKQYQGEIATMQTQLKQGEQELQEFEIKHKNLVSAAHVARRQSNQAADDPALKAAAKQAEVAQQQHHRLLVQQGQSLEEGKKALDHLGRQQQGLGNQRAVALKELQKLAVEGERWKDHQQQQKLRRDRTAKLGQSILQNDKQSKALAGQLKKSEESLAVAQKSLDQSRRHGEVLKRQAPKLEKRLQRWRAAAVNTEAIHLAEKSQAMQQNQSQAMDRFAELAAELAQIKVSDSDGLRAKKSSALIELRQQIDREAAAVIQQAKAAAEQKKKYFQAMKSIEG